MTTFASPAGSNIDELVAQFAAEVAGLFEPPKNDKPREFHRPPVAEIPRVDTSDRPFGLPDDN